MKTVHALTIAAILLSAISAASAADFYIAINGNDANPGTIDKPWSTFTNASEVLLLLVPSPKPRKLFLVPLRLFAAILVPFDLRRLAWPSR